MTEVRYGMTRTGGWEAWVIRTATRSTVNHAFITDGTKVIEADPHGLQYNKLTSYPRAILSDPIGGPQADIAWNWSVAHLGTGYGWLDIVAIALACYRVPTPRWAVRRLTSSNTLICSQAVCMAYAAAGIPLGNKTAGMTTPGDLLHFLRHEPVPQWW